MGILVSIVMPVYNGEQFLKEAIESVKKQTIENWEFIIVNDASDDNTEDIVLEAVKLDKRIVYLKNEKNRGVAYSLNKGLDVARGKYIARVDVDDPIFPTRLEVQSAYMEQHAEVGVLASAYQYDDGKIIKAHIQQNLKKHEVKASFLIDNPIPHSSVMLRKSIFDEYDLRYDVNYKLEDFELWTRAVKYTEIVILKQVLLKHRVHPASVCSKMGNVFHENIMQIVKKFVKETYNVDVEPYTNEHFHTMNINLKDIVKENYRKYAADEFKLLCEIERANEKTGFVDKFILAKVLKQKWNWVLWCLQLEKTGNKVLSRLEEDEFGSFRTRFIASLLSNKVIKDESITEQQIADMIIRPDKVSVKKKIIVYGLGIKCYDYFDPSSESIDTENIQVVAFCDRDVSMIGDRMFGKRVIMPSNLPNEEYDFIAVTSNKYYDEIKIQLMHNYNIDADRIQKMDTIDL